MRRQLDVEQVLDLWLAEGPTEIADRVVDSALRQIDQTPQRRLTGLPRRPILMPLSLRLAVAAALVIAVETFYLLLNRPASSVGTASPTPSALTTPSSSPIASSPSAPAPAATVAGAVSLPTRTEARPGVTYAPGSFEPIFSFKASAGWWVINDSATQFSLVRGPNEPNGPDEFSIEIIQPSGVIDPGGSAAPLPADLIAWLRARPDLSVSAPTAVRLGAATGRLVEATFRTSALPAGTTGVDMICPLQGLCNPGQGGMIGAPTTHRFELVVLAVGGTQVAISLDAPATNWTANRATLNAVLDSISFPRQ